MDHRIQSKTKRTCSGFLPVDQSRFKGTAAAAPPPFRPGNPALCGSHPLVTPYYCRLGDLLCFVFLYVCLLHFYPRDAMLARVQRVRPSVSQSRAGIVSMRHDFFTIL